MPPQFPWWLYGTIITLPIGGPLLKVGGKVARPAVGWLGRQLVLKPVWKAQQGFVNPLTAWQTYDTLHTWSERAEMAIAIAQIVDGSSSQDLVQNGGPSAPPLRQSGRPSDVLSLGKTLKTQSAHGFRSGKARTASGKRRSRREKKRKCPKGWHWSNRYNTCVRTAGFWKR